MLGSLKAGMPFAPLSPEYCVSGCHAKKIILVPPFVPRSVAQLAVRLQGYYGKDPDIDMMVKITNEMRYALRAVFELAKREGGGPVKGADIAQAQAIPVRFLEVILCKLKRIGIVKSKRGYQGGYFLGRSVGEITVSSVFEPLDSSPCLWEGGDCTAAGQEGCPFSGDCAFLALWEKARYAIQEIYRKTTIEDLLNSDGALPRSNFL
jgi:Rrf2 family protein